MAHQGQAFARCTAVTRFGALARAVAELRSVSASAAPRNQVRRKVKAVSPASRERPERALPRPYVGRRTGATPHSRHPARATDARVNRPSASGAVPGIGADLGRSPVRDFEALRA